MSITTLCNELQSLPKRFNPELVSDLEQLLEKYRKQITDLEKNLVIAQNQLSGYNGYEFTEEGTRLRFRGMPESYIQERLREYHHKRQQLQESINNYKLSLSQIQ